MCEKEEKREGVEKEGEKRRGRKGERNVNGFLKLHNRTHLFAQMMDLKNKQKQYLQQEIFFHKLPMLQAGKRILSGSNEGKRL